MSRARRIARLSGKQTLLFAVVGSLSVSALLAIGILLFGDFGETEGRILGTTALLAGYGLLALPAGILLDQGRLLRLAVAVLALAAGGLALALAAVWLSDPPEALGKGITTVTAFAIASTQTAALAARRHDRDPRSVRGLFVASVVLALVLGALATATAWAEIEDEESFFRIVAALAVLDVLVVVLQPILALTRPTGGVYRLRMLVEPGGETETTIEATDFAGAVARTIRTIERGGRHVLRVERIEQTSEAPCRDSKESSRARAADGSVSLGGNDA